MISLVNVLGEIHFELIEGEHAMIPFNLDTLEGLTEEQKNIAMTMLVGIKHRGGTAYLTIHGKKLTAGNTLRRPGPHTDGNYEPVRMTFSGNGGWKIGENGPGINTALHHRQYNSDRGGIILASNVSACRGWTGNFDALPGVGGDCSHIKLTQGFKLEANRVYYGNNHFIHESLPVDEDCHRVFVRITMPEDHVFSGEESNKNVTELIATTG